MIGPVFTAFAALYLLWYGWRVFVADKGDLGGLGLAFAAICVIDIMAAMRDFL